MSCMYLLLVPCVVPQGSHSGHFTPNRGTGNRNCVCLTGSELSVVRMDENRLGIQETVWKLVTDDSGG